MLIPTLAKLEETVVIGQGVMGFNIKRGMFRLGVRKKFLL